MVFDPSDDPIAALTALAQRHHLSKEDFFQVVTEGYQKQLSVLNKDIEHTLNDMRAQTAAIEAYQMRGVFPDKVRAGRKYLEVHQHRLMEDQAYAAYLVAVPLVALQEAGMPLIVKPTEAHAGIAEATRELFGPDDGFDRMAPEKLTGQARFRPHQGLLSQMSAADVMKAAEPLAGPMPEATVTLADMGISAQTLAGMRSGRTPAASGARPYCGRNRSLSCRRRPRRRPWPRNRRHHRHPRPSKETPTPTRRRKYHAASPSRDGAGGFSRSPAGRRSSPCPRAVSR